MYKINVNEIPFSMYGSYIRITKPRERLLIGTASSLPISLKGSETWNHDYFEIALYKNDTELSYQYEASYEMITLTTTEGQMQITFKDTLTLSFQANGLDIKLIPCHLFVNKYNKPNGEVLVLDHAGRVSTQIRASKGTEIICESSSTVDGYSNQNHESKDSPYSIYFKGNEEVRSAVRFANFETVWEEDLLDFNHDLNQMKGNLDSWMSKLPSVSEKYLEAAKIAWYINWTCTVEPQGILGRTTVLMSKNWMNKIWAWDNCFNALAIVDADPKLAWDQLLLFFDFQGENGIIPDAISDLDAVYGYVKPPIYGWTIMKLIEKMGIENCTNYIEQIYEPVKKLTNWWFTFRDYDKDGMCQYHHGNDSGWDNSSIFDQGFPTEAADLAGHLALQMEALSYMAEVLGKNDEATEWKQRAQKQLENLFKHCVKDGRFVSPMDGKHTVEPTLSLLNYITVVLGHRIPDEIKKTVFKDLEPDGLFLTEYGLATESPSSEKYSSDGYWRGPIWAPSTYLIFDGLIDAKEYDLAKIIAERFCDMCAKEPGMYENYDALTGQGLRCPGYSWTASVFLLLANWLKHN